MEIVALMISAIILFMFIAYWIMPVPKMKAVNKEMKSLLAVLPISLIIKAITKDKPK